MIIYNVTVIIDHSVETEWLHWMKSKHIPDVMDTGCFLEYRMSKILSGEHDGGTSYSIQYLCNSMETYNDYVARYSDKLQHEHTQKYQGKFGAFRTLMNIESMTTS